MSQLASITLMQNDDARPVIDSIIADNPGVKILTMPGAIKLDCEGKITVNRASVEERLGRPWNLQELHLVLISMAGNLDEDDDYFTLSWRH
ncbi:MmoB/DmpM family protein [Acidocella sp.]|uniref:MmoB/DmpM family protein n=2 Tax=Acidocella sp. TaxID=50710 RepID=UPI002609EF5C|nr:MmoB/DmpM family protein [Acidocella sp.]